MTTEENKRENFNSPIINSERNIQGENEYIRIQAKKINGFIKLCDILYNERSHTFVTPREIENILSD